MELEDFLEAGKYDTQKAPSVVQEYPQRRMGFSPYDVNNPALSMKCDLDFEDFPGIHAQCRDTWCECKCHLNRTVQRVLPQQYCEDCHLMLLSSGLCKLNCPGWIKRQERIKQIAKVIEESRNVQSSGNLPVLCKGPHPSVDADIKSAQARILSRFPSHRGEGVPKECETSIVVDEETGRVERCVVNFEEGTVRRKGD